MYQPAPGQTYTPPEIFVKNLPLPITNKFAYLGSTLSNSVSIDDEINNRIAKASAAFGRLRKTVWNRRGITLETKMKVYRAVVLPTLLYGCETWTVYSRHARKLNHFHTTRLRSIMNIKWHQRIPDTAVLTRAMTTSIHTMLMKHQARWAGHIVRMDDDRIPKRLFYGELSEGKRSQGGQKKRYKNSLKVSLKTLQIDTSPGRVLLWSGQSGAVDYQSVQQLLRREGWLRLRRKGAREKILQPPILQTRLCTCVPSAKDFFKPGSALSATGERIET